MPGCCHIVLTLRVKINFAVAMMALQSASTGTDRECNANSDNENTLISQLYHACFTV